METVTAQQSDSKYKFSEPLKVVNIAVKSKESKKNDGHVYNFSLPIDVSFPLTSNFGTNTDSYTGFGKRFKRSQTEWECDTCLVRNKLEEEKCVACETSRKPMTLFNDASFGQQFKKSLNKWECDTCMVQNKLESTKCAACETPRKENNLRPFGSSTVETSDYMLFKQFRFGCAKSNADDGFRTLAAHQKASKWECSACMTQNDNSNNKCVCCEQQKPGCKGVESKGAPSPGAPKFTFGFVNALNATTENDLRKASANECTEVIKANVDSWECTTCKTSNKNEGIACLACQSKKPVPQFKFGFSNSNTTSSDANFSALAAKQKSSKWECSACMTQNDNNNNKCVCCEQKKPGSTEVESKETPSSGSTKFTFGFGNGVNAPTEDDLKKVSSNEKVTIILKNGSWECAICKTSNKNEADACLACQSKKSVPQFKFGLANSNITPGDVNFSALAAQQKISKWECSACMTQNDNNNNKCVCCEQKKPGSTEVESKETPSSGSTKFRFGFGNGVNSPTKSDLSKASSSQNAGNIKADAGFRTLAVQQKNSKWECSVCMTQNDKNKAICVCCEQPKLEPGDSQSKTHEFEYKYTATTNKFHFGFGAGAASEDELRKELVQKDTTANDSFKTLAAEQKLSKWECETCMTHNDNDLSKCVCCRQTTPTAKTESEKQLHRCHKL